MEKDITKKRLEEHNDVYVDIFKGRRSGCAQSKAEAVARNMFKRKMSAEGTAAICEVKLSQLQAWFKEWGRTQG